MRPHNNAAHANLPAALSQVANQFLGGFELRAGGLIAIKVSHKANSERDVVQIIAVHMPAIDLAAPTIAHFYLAVPARCSVANHEMISKAVVHPADTTVIIIERARVSLPCSAIVHDNKLPTPPLYWRATNCFDDRTR